MDRQLSRRPRLPQSEAGLGVLLGFVAYGLWGVFPFYFRAFDGVPVVEVVAQRVVWSLVFLAILTTVTRTWYRTIRLARTARTTGLLALAAVFLAVNWGTFVYAVGSDQVVEGALGYFINPLVSVGLGVIVLRERMRPGQWAAVAVAVIAVGVLTVSYGRIPWISLVLALSFGLYGLVKKQAGAGAVESLTIETALMLPIAMLVIVLSALAGHSGFSFGPWIVLLLILFGPVTALPLLAFGGAATRIPLSTLGLMQYIAPVLQFLIGVLAFGESMPAIRWFGFALIWLSLAVLSADGLRHSRHGRTTTDDLEVMEPD